MPVIQNVRKTIGCLGCDVSEEVGRTIWQGAAEMARELDLNLIFYAGGGLNDPLVQRRPANVIYDLVHPLRLDGLMVISSSINYTNQPAEMLAFMHRCDPLPVVSVEEIFPGIPSVVKDDLGGMKQAVNHLIEVHHRRRIIFIQGPAVADGPQDRFRGYRDALAEHGLPFDPNLVVPVPNSWLYQEGLIAFRAFLEEHTLQPRFDFDAVVACNDDNAAAAITVLKEMGARIPDDIAVTGFDDLSPAGSLSPPLTTVRPSFKEMGRKAVELLAGMLPDTPGGRGEAAAPPVVMPSQLVVRHSCGCLLPTITESVVDLQTRPGQSAAHSAGLAAALSRERRVILLEMAQAAGGSPVAYSESARLLNGLIGEIEHGRAGAFLSALDETLNQVALRGERIKEWQGAVSVLRRRVPPHLSSESALAAADNLWHQSRVMIAESAWRNQARKRLLGEEQARQLRDFGSRLSTVQDMEDLIDILARELPGLGVLRCYLSLYEDAAHPAGTARLALGYDEHGLLSLPGEQRVFSSANLAPEAVWQRDGRFSLLVEPLYLRDMQLGFILLETEGQEGTRESALWEALQTQISSALVAAMLHRDAVHARREAEAGWKLAEERRQAAEEANQLKSRFLSMVSHEMRTPLNVIAGLSENLIQQHSEDEPGMGGIYRDLQRIHASAQHLDNLIRDVLDLAVSHIGQLKIVSEPLELSEVISPVIELAERLAAEKRLIWEVEIEPGLPRIAYDRTRLRQVLINLVTNAIKFTESGRVLLRVRSENGSVRFDVQDTGLGIPPEEQALIFEEFRRSERASARGYGGMGLGLAICRRLIEMGGGTIRVESSGDIGSGSTFIFTLPAIQIQPVSSPIPPSSTVMVIHDNEDARLAAQLTRSGFQVVEFSVERWPECEQAILTAPPGAVVLDIRPASHLGWEIAAAFKNDARLATIPVLFCTLNQEHGVLYELNTLQKPLAGQQLVQALEREGFASPQPARSILIVDDEPGNLDLHARLVERHLPSCRVRRAQTGREALQQMSAEKPSLVLLDLMMPDMNGFEVLDAMRLSDSLRSVPVIVLTSQKLAEREMQLLNQGVNAVLEKGLFSAQETLSHLEAALTRGKHRGSEARRVARLAMAFIHEHYRDPLSRKDLAEAAGVSQEYLSTCFHKETGVTPSDYLERYRIKQARRLLETTDLPVTRVALEVGFFDSSYFGRVFRREIGVSPVAYRRGEHK
jgi:signal transduction histidine kinase/DNA-binding LacI/PurR family transcriptional regulator/CheY-like chemotaxis protein